MEFFPEPGFEFQLDPSYEPERTTPRTHLSPPPNPDNNIVFAILQMYNRVYLVVLNGAPHMWHATMQSKTVQLTALGEHYRKLVAKGLL